MSGNLTFIKKTGLSPFFLSDYVNVYSLKKSKRLQPKKNVNVYKSSKNVNVYSLKKCKRL